MCLKTKKSTTTFKNYNFIIKIDPHHGHQMVNTSFNLKKYHTIVTKLNHISSKYIVYN
jgi:hypothetical protein